MTTTSSSNSPPKIPLELQKERHERHIKLMKMITSYELSREEKNKLQKIKSHTMMEINLRYLRSEINRNYQFPKFTKSSLGIHTSEEEEESYLSSTDNDEEEDRLLREELEESTDNTKGNNTKQKKKPSEYFVYDLRSQNEPKKHTQQEQLQFKPFPTKILSLEQSRRVHSLGNEKSQERQDMIIKRHNPLKNSSDRFAKSPPNIIQTKSTKSLKTIKPIQTRKSSKNYLALEQSLDKSPHSTVNSKNLLVDSRKLKLPEINSFSGNSRSLKKLSPINHEKLKTEKMYEEEDIQYAIGKKLVTEAADSGKKTIKGVEKYLKELEAEKQQIMNQGGRMMKKEKEQEKRRLNLELLKTAKHSLKRELEE